MSLFRCVKRIEFKIFSGARLLDYCVLKSTILILVVMTSNKKISQMQHNKYNKWTCFQRKISHSLYQCLIISQSSAFPDMQHNTCFWITAKLTEYQNILKDFLIFKEFSPTVNIVNESSKGWKTSTFPYKSYFFHLHLKGHYCCIKPKNKTFITQ